MSGEAQALAAPEARPAEEFDAAVAHQRARRFDEAETIYLRLLETAPGHPNVLHMLGIIEIERGQPERGADLIQQAFPALSESPEPHVDLGNALRMTGKGEQAVECYRRALALRPDYVLAHTCLGSTLSEMGRFEAALGHCRTALAIDPRSLSARIVLAMSLQSARRLPEAAQAWREVINLEPERAESFYQLTGQMIALGAIKEALHCADRAIALRPDNALFHCARGQVLMRLYDGERSVASFRRALALSPNLKEGWAGLGWSLRLLGRFEEADACTKRLHELDPADLRVVAHVPSTGRQSQGADQVEHLASVLDDPAVKIDDRIMAGFALGRLLDEARRYDEAFARYTTANALMRQSWPTGGDRFDASGFTKSIDALIATNTREYLADAAHIGNISELPVFVFGMPRSGTTLVEQICSSHSRIHGAGELDSVSRIALALAPHRNDQAKLSDAARRAADAHIVHLHRLGRGAVRVTDKLPDNVLLVGLIARLFPRARFVYCSRDPRDISLSCYFQRFSTGAQYFSYDLADCAKRCRDVQRLAAHWLALLPLHMIEVNYEKLVGDLEGESRRLIDFMDLSWEPSCLDFHHTERTVATVSHWQVRQPLYTSSIGRWRHYEKHLDPLFTALGDTSREPAALRAIPAAVSV